MSVTMGEVAFVLLINHTKLPDGKYLVEKDDGNSERSIVVAVLRPCMSHLCVLLEIDTVYILYFAILGSW